MKNYFLILVIMLSFIFNQSYSSESGQKTLYIYRPLINAYDLQQWAQEQGLKIINADDLHVTLAYSREGLERVSEKMEVDSSDFCNSDPDYLRQLDFFGKEKSTLVLKLNAPELIERWEELTTAGAKWDWPHFEPHVTLSYESQEFNIEEITPYYGDLLFGPEVWVELE